MCHRNSQTRRKRTCSHPLWMSCAISLHTRIVVMISDPWVSLSVSRKNRGPSARYEFQNTFLQSWYINHVNWRRLTSCWRKYRNTRTIYKLTAQLVSQPRNQAVTVGDCAHSRPTLPFPQAKIPVPCNGFRTARICSCCLASSLFSPVLAIVDHTNVFGPEK